MVQSKRAVGLSLIGLPGSGKSTLCRNLEKQRHWEVFVVGDALRKLAERNPGLGDTLARGLLAPELYVETMIRGIAAATEAARVVFDGFPRHVGQLALFYELFDDPLFIYLKIDPALAKERLASRYASGQMRPEDAPSTIAHRLAQSEVQLGTLLRDVPSASVLTLNAADAPSALLAATMGQLEKLHVR